MGSRGIQLRPGNVCKKDREEIGILWLCKFSRPNINLSDVDTKTPLNLSPEITGP
jgi:hypothetical protein